MNYKYKKHLYEDTTNNSFEERVAYANQQLQNGVDPMKVFDYVNFFIEGFAAVKLVKKWNFINTKGELLCNRWFDAVADFHEGFAEVLLNDKWNFIDTDGNYLRDDVWFDDTRYFYDGFAMVQLGDKWNFIDHNGNYLRDDLWFDNALGFREGFAEVELNGKWYFLDTKGNLCDEDGNPINNVTENRRRVVRMTESQLRNTIKRVVAQCLNERRIR